MGTIAPLNADYAIFPIFTRVLWDFMGFSRTIVRVMVFAGGFGQVQIVRDARREMQYIYKERTCVCVCMCMYVCI